MRNDQELFDCVNAVLARHYADPAFGILQFAAHLGISDRQLQRRLNELVSCGPAQYLRDFRLRVALGLLQNGHSIGDVADAVGFTSHAYFTTCFKAKFGVTPSRFKDGCRVEPKLARWRNK
jgi:AraC-like DNA-binding protein